MIRLQHREQRDLRRVWQSTEDTEGNIPVDIIFSSSSQKKLNIIFKQQLVEIINSVLSNTTWIKSGDRYKI